MQQYRVWFIVAACLICSFFFLSMSVDSGAGDNPVEAGFISTVSNAHSLVNGIWKRITGFFGHYLLCLGADKENVRLREERDALMWEINRYREMALQNDRLRNLLDFSVEYSYEFMVAEVICWDASNWASSLF
ncbi:hypothetical protein JW905_06195, partial [bacterium]|nr:hypothetical protein [candidate division CSSED10-310 bacterium]